MGETVTATPRRWLPALLLLCLVGCGARPDMRALSPIGEAAAPGTAITVHVATSRARSVPDRNSFTNERARATNFAAYTVSVPPGHRPGRIEWPGRQPDPAASFATLRDSVLDAPTFEAELASRRCAPGAGQTMVFVHGYNTNLPEALFRLVQITADTDPRAIPILFSWPSDALPLAYVADRDAAAYSRDNLAELLTRLTQLCPGRPVILVGHSMGGWLSMETLRQLRLAGRDQVLNALQVVLASPDIDLDVFRAQARVIGPLTPPMTVLVSSDDRALSVSSRLAGARPRLGSLSVEDPAVQQTAREAHLSIIDISAMEASDRFNHDRYVSFANTYARLAAQGAIEPGGGLRRAGAFVFNAIGATVSSPFRLAGRVLSPD